ncbi:MAG: hypothetical protein ACLQVL_13145 [Terriglobia bacterium]
MKKFLVVFFCIVTPLIAEAGDKGYRISYAGGSLPAVKAGTGLKMYFESNQLRLVKDKDDFVTVSASAITEISHGDDVYRRVRAVVADGTFNAGPGAPPGSSRARKHLIGVTWANGDRKGGLAIQCDESNYRSILAGLEEITGLRAISSEPMAARN